MVDLKVKGRINSDIIPPLGCFYGWNSLAWQCGAMAVQLTRLEEEACILGDHETALAYQKMRQPLVHAMRYLGLAFTEESSPQGSRTEQQVEKVAVEPEAHGSRGRAQRRADCYFGWNTLSWRCGTTVAQLKSLQEQARTAGHYKTADMYRDMWQPLAIALRCLKIVFEEDSPFKDHALPREKVK